MKTFVVWLDEIKAWLWAELGNKAKLSPALLGLGLSLAKAYFNYAPPFSPIIITHQFDIPIEELIQIYILYIRPVVEQYATVRHSSITKGKKNDLEITQKVALKIIFGNSYTTYSDVLEWAGFDTLAARRTKLCLNFAMKYTKN